MQRVIEEKSTEIEANQPKVQRIGEQLALYSMAKISDSALQMLTFSFLLKTTKKIQARILFFCFYKL